MSSSRIKLVILLMVALSGIWLTYRYRIPIMAWTWHLRHKTIRVGKYSVPVPKNWYPKNLGDDSHLLARLDTEDTSPTKRVKAHAGILLSVAVRPFSEEDVRKMTNVETVYLEKEGVAKVVTRTFSSTDVTITCVGGDRLSSAGSNDQDLTAWSCKGSGGLEMSVTATQPDLPDVWKILSGIRKES